MKIRKSNIKVKYLIFLPLIAILLLPNIARADIFGALDYVEQALNALEEYTGIPMNTWVRILLIYLIGLFLFLLSGTFLQNILTLPLKYYSLISLNNPFVVHSWAIVSGIVNMSIILFLLIIAFAYILKIESFRAKQAFVQLIIVAFLINFSLLFVKALFDITNILYNAILRAVGVDLINNAFNTLYLGIWQTFLSIAGGIMLSAASMFVPYANIAAQYGMLVLWVMAGYTFLPTYLSQILLSFVFTFIFSILSLILAMRYFVIWILAAVSPLAFLCWAFPQTKKYWNEWLKYLLEWMFVGISAVFLLGLGIKTIPDIGGVFSLRIWQSNILIPPFLFYYIFLTIYLLLVIWLIRKSMPTFAEFLITNLKTIGSISLEKGVKPFLGEVGKRWENITISQGKWEERLKEREKAGEKISLATQFAKWATKGVTYPTRLAYRAVGVTPEFMAQKRVEKEMEKFEKAYGKDIHTAISAHLGVPLGSAEQKAALGLYLAKMGGGKGIEKLDIEKQRETIEAIAHVTPKRLKDFVKHKPELIDDEKVGEVIKRVMVPKGLERDERGVYKDEDVRRLIGIGVSETDAVRKAAFKKAVDAMEVADIENLAVSTIENKDFQEMVARFKPWGFIRRLGEEKGYEYLEKLQTKAEEIGLEEIAKTNPQFVRAPYTSVGSLFLRPWRKKP